MRRRYLAAFALLVAPGCGPSTGPAVQPTVVSPLGLEPPPIYSLLGFRQELELTSAQVTALDSIAEGVRRENAPLVQELRDRTPSRTQQRGLVLVDEGAEPVLDQLRENNRAAMEAVREVLNEEQRAEVCRLNADENHRLGRSQQERESDRRRMERLARSDARVTGARGWSWCGIPPVDEG